MTELEFHPVADLTEDEARALTEEIRGRVVDLLPLIKQAYEGRADRALGYDCWQDYCAGELEGMRIPLADRPAMVADLRSAGMSTRAIGSALGIGQTQVRRDFNELSPNGSVDLPERVTSLDGRERPATRPPMPARQDQADAIVAGIDRRPDIEPDRPLPPAWDPEERRRHEEEVRRIRDIEAARRQAETIVTDVLAAVVTVVAGCRYGDKGLVTKDMIREMREAIDLLEGEL